MNGQSSVLPNPGFGHRIGRQLPASPWNHAKEILIHALDALGDWQVRAAERRTLMTLDDRALHDLGMNRGSADAEASKPFWRL
jgi:uncharacterized protein YjiS (DUF1127 family)